MKKIKLFSLFAAMFFVGSAMAETVTTGTYSKRTINDDGTISTWDFASMVTSDTKFTETVVDEDIVYIPSQSQKIKFTTSGLSCNAESSIYLPVPSGSAGTITMSCYSNSDGRQFDLYVGETKSTEKNLPSSKTASSFNFASTDITTLEDGKTYLHLKDNRTEMKVSSFSITLTIGSYGAGTIAQDDATLKSITVNNVEVEGFDAATTAYDVVLPFGTTEVPVVAATATSANATVSITQAEAVDGSASILVTAEDDITTKTYTINFSVAEPSHNATLSAITVNGEALEGFTPAQLTYGIELAYGTTFIPTVAATTTDEKATYTVTYVDAEGAETTFLPCTATITVTAEDGTTKQTYTIEFTVSATASTDATLASISIDGNAIADFKADSLDYTHTIAYVVNTIPEITAVVHDETANLNITQTETIPGTATIVVTAQAGNTQTYTVTISRAAAIKHLTVVPFANGAKGAINEKELTVTAPYMIGEDVPTVAEADIEVIGDGTPSATLSEDGKSITLKGADDVEAVYTVITQGIKPDTLTAAEITFTGEEKYIFAPYGWASDKGWKFAKKLNEETNMRDASGNTRIYMALPPAESVKLTSGTSARAVVIYVNGAKSDVNKTAEKGSSITIPLNQTANNLVAIESNQTSGDGGFTKMQLVNPSNPIGSSVEQAQAELKAAKIIRNGQLLIIREGKTYTAQGVQLQ